MTVLATRIIELENRDDAANVLRRRSAEVNWGEDNVSEILRNLRDTFLAGNVSVGLSAVQIGINKRVFILNEKKDDPSREVVAINPKIVEMGPDSAIRFESCMSVPNVKLEVNRRLRVRLKYQDEKSEWHDEWFENFRARIVQHEYDHLEGRLCIDYESELTPLEEANYLTEENYPVPPVDGAA